MTKTDWSASCLIIGDEILSGKTHDRNSYCLAQFLFDLGIDLKRIEVVPDDEQEIAEAVKRLSGRYDFVFTSGGIGPTHDDITYASVAKAFGLSLELHPETWEAVQQLRSRQHQSSSSSSPMLKSLEAYKQMATFPTPSQHLRMHTKVPIPVVLVNNNVYILPGIPQLFDLLLHSLSDHLRSRINYNTSSLKSYHRCQVATKQSEAVISDMLARIQQSVLDDHIKIGSYPVWKDAHGIKVIVSIVGKDITKVDHTAKLVADQINGWIYDSTCRSSRI